MAGNAEAVGRLLADSALMRGERELLRKKDDAQPEPAKPGAQPAAPALVNDAKAVAAVLLTLLDERLQASDTEAASGGKTSTGVRRQASDDAANSPQRVGARYAEDGLIAYVDPTGIERRPETGIETAMLAGEQRMRDVPPSASPELQSFLQRLAAFAGMRSEAMSFAGGKGDGRGARRSAVASGDMSMMRVAIAAVVLLWLGVMIFGWLSA